MQNYFASTGLKVFVHNKSFNPLSFEDNSWSMQPGEETRIAIRRTFSSSVPFPYSQCVDLSHGHSSDLYSYIINSNRTYRQKDCLQLCYQQAINQLCKCTDVRYPTIDSKYPLCFNSTQILCSFIKDVPTCDCPLECDSVTYESSI